MGRVLLYCLTVFLSAFLLFQVQPVVGKYILPWFGSTPGVWTTCMLFFQVLLLGGYAYAHFLVSRLPPKRQAILHAVLLGLALLALPITPSESLVPDGSDAPVGAILWVLAASVGAPYLLLSATGPLLQGWFARLHPGRSPYRLYALSNVGSLLALLSYPIYVERAWGLQQQTLVWSVGFGVFALLGAACAWTLHRGRMHASGASEDALAEPRGAAPAATEEPAAPRLGTVVLWFLLSATGSAMLLATTNQMCLDIAVVPFLWIAPLALYLLSFILTFDHARWYARPLFLGLLPLVLWRAYSLLAEGVNADIAAQIVGYGLALFVACMCCHGELSRSKPAPKHLTFFFLIVSIGGATGGLLVALVAHSVFQDFYEFPILLAATYGVVLLAVIRNLGAEGPSASSSWLRQGLRALAGCAVLCAVLYATMELIDPETWTAGESQRKKDAAAAWFEGKRFWLWLPACVVPVLAEALRYLRGPSFAVWWGRLRVNALVAGSIVGSLGLVALITVCGWVMRDPDATVIARGRNFYGTLAIKEYYANSSDWDWTLRHGRIMHGFQLKKRAGWPTSYYGPESGAGLAVRFHPARWTKGRSFRIGVVGLGTGTMAAYANARLDPSVRWSDRTEYAVEERRVPGDVVRYYEINPMVVDWAWEHFTFLPDARARGADVDVFVGDARLVMQRQREREELQSFDVLAIDAFSSDAIPIHLLTRESFDVYWAHLKEDGALAIHVTNRYIDLKPVVRKLAASTGRSVVHIDNRSDDDFGIDSSDWLVITTNEALLRELRLAEVEGKAPPRVADTAWTDDYSSVWPWVKFDHEFGGWRDALPILGLEGAVQGLEDGLRHLFGEPPAAAKPDDGEDDDEFELEDD